jgi:uncharacterized protein
MSGVKLRAVTLGMDLPVPAARGPALREAAAFLRQAREAFGALGVEVQTTRVAGPELGDTLARLGAPGGDALRHWARASEAAAREAGVDYLALGRVPTDRPDLVERDAAAILAAGETVFLSADLVEAGRPSPAMAAACARAVRALAETTPLGFGNLRFAATASCPPNIPFFPAAYHAGGPPRFALAIEAADVVLAALRRPGTMSELEAGLVEALEAALGPVERAADALGRGFAYPFVGIDLSPAPFPSPEVSIGGAVEAAGVDRFGAPGTLYVAALVTRALRRARVRRTGFSGLMLPVLEDSTLARRVAERPLDLHALLLYSAVCGTGLDTVPLPGNASADEIAGILLDVAALSVALDGKPLTARLLPVPGAAPGDETAYTFEFFANTRVLPAAGAGPSRLLGRGR